MKAVTITDATHAALKAHCAENLGANMSAVADQAISEYIERQNQAKKDEQNAG